MDPEQDEPSSDNEDRRAFIRHPADIPIEIETPPGDSPARAADVSYGGLAFLSGKPKAVGTPLRIRIPGAVAALDARAFVAWCQPEGDGYRIGVRFDTAEDAFRSRQLEQLFAIERFRQQLARTEGREIARDEAAREWIKRHASRFPDP